MKRTWDDILPDLRRASAEVGHDELAREARVHPNSSSNSGANTPRIGLKNTTAVKLVRHAVATIVQP